MQRRTKWIAGSALALAVIGGGTAVVMAGDGIGSNDDDAPLTGDVLDAAAAAALEEAGGGTVTDSEQDDGGGYELEVTLDDGSQVDVTLDDSYGVVYSEIDDRDDDRDDVDADGPDDDSDDAPLTGATLESATAAALAEVGDGTVTDSEQNANGTYDIEVTLADGTEFDVHLDAEFTVTASQLDSND